MAMSTSTSSSVTTIYGREMSPLGPMTNEYDDVIVELATGESYTYQYDDDDDLNTSSSTLSPEIDWEDLAEMQHFERVVRIVVSVIFGIIAVLGLVGNLSVIVVVVANKSMRSTTNILIIGLAVADLVFIIVCVPFTALSYVLTVWPFGQLVCKIYQYVIHVTAHASVYTLVLMSFDRYLAVVHPISSMTVRTQRNACLAVAVSWTIICAANAPMLVLFEEVPYVIYDEDRSTCMSKRLISPGKHEGRIFYGTFFVFAFVLPLTAVCILYGCMVHRLRRKNMATQSQRPPACASTTTAGKKTSESVRAKRRVTLMIVVVVAIFAICWLPLQVIFMIQYFSSEETNVDDSTSFVVAKIAANCLAYMNSCVNPILYAFLSENFRKGFWRLIPCVCGIGFAPLSKMEVERTSARYAVARGTAATGRTGALCPRGSDNGHQGGLSLAAINVGNPVGDDQREFKNDMVISAEGSGL